MSNDLLVPPDLGEMFWQSFATSTFKDIPGKVDRLDILVFDKYGRLVDENQTPLQRVNESGRRLFRREFTNEDQLFRRRPYMSKKQQGWLSDQGKSQAQWSSSSPAPEGEVDDNSILNRITEASVKLL